MSSTLFINLVLAVFVALIVSASGNPIENTIDEHDTLVCPPGVSNGLIDGVVIYPRELRCSMVGGMCVESDKCKSLVSAKGMCPENQHRGVECCFELEPQYVPCHQA